MFNKTIASILTALAIVVSAQAAAAEPVCTGQLLQVHMAYDRDPPSAARARAAPPLVLPQGTPTCVQIAFDHTRPPPSDAARLQAAVGALNYVCTRERVEAMQGRYIVEGQCTLDDGTVVVWRARPQPPRQQ